MKDHDWFRVAGILVMLGEVEEMGSVGGQI